MSAVAGRHAIGFEKKGPLYTEAESLFLTTHNFMVVIAILYRLETR